MTVKMNAMFGFAMIAVLTGCGDAGSSMQKGFEDGFKTQFTDNFTKSCQSSAGDSGLGGLGRQRDPFGIDAAVNGGDELNGFHFVLVGRASARHS